MKYLNINILIFFLILSGCHPVIDKNSPEYIGSILHDKIPDGWHCEIKNSTVTIQYKDKVYKATPWCRSPFDELPWSKECLFIKLDFKKRITHAEYDALVNKRNKLLAPLDNKKGIDGKTKWGMKRKLLLKNPLPKYFNDQYSIFIERSEDPFNDDFIQQPITDEDGTVLVIPLYTLIKPEKVKEERNNILQIIDEMFPTYRKK